MKILYAVQATGNGHISRAMEMTPHLQKYGDVDILLSGTQADIILPYDITYRKHGMSFVFGRKGGIDFPATFRILKPIRLFRDIYECPVKQYDVVIHDFEPITAWACWLRKHPCIGLSHQGAFLSDKTPRPKHRPFYGEWMLRNFAPAQTNFGFHFKPYDSFIHTPIVRKKIREAKAKVARKAHVAVYLPAYDEYSLVPYFQKIRSIRWKIFSKKARTSSTIGNVDIFPVGDKEWIDALATAEAALLGAGFQSPSEALFLGKKLMAIPMYLQYEQQCNAVALSDMGVAVCKKGINKYFADYLNYWLKEMKPIEMDYKDESDAIAQKILATV